MTPFDISTCSVPVRCRWLVPSITLLCSNWCYYQIKYSPQNKIPPHLHHKRIGPHFCVYWSGSEYSHDNVESARRHVYQHIVGIWPCPKCNQRQCAVSLCTASAAASRSWRGWSLDGFPGSRCFSFDIRSVSVDWVYYSYRYPAHWRIPPLLQARWLLFAGSVRLCLAGEGRRWSAVQKNHQQLKPCSAQTTSSSHNSEAAIQPAESSTW